LPCRDEVAVSVLTPPKLAVFANEAPRNAEGAVPLCESRELAGRARRRAERANTIVNEKKFLGDQRLGARERRLSWFL
jgi:hypothetical protein